MFGVQHSFFIAHNVWKYNLVNMGDSFFTSSSRPLSTTAALCFINMNIVFN